MQIGIGIDTGGTYTDAVAFDFETRTVLAKGKSRTTKEDLSVGICGALDHLPEGLLVQAGIVSLSTTLATNACVENKGGRAKLVLMGTPEKVLHRVDAEHAYGFRYDDVLCLDTHCSFDGSFVDMPDWARVIEENSEWLRGAQALSLTEAQAARNGAVCEKEGLRALRGAGYDVPIVLGSELSSDVNMMARGATALLNARLLPVVEEFLHATARALVERGVTGAVMIVRSDGALMSEELAFDRPVETILSGPAASVHGSRELAGLDTCLIVDMGGTTTDISLVVGGEPIMTSGISIGGWRTQAKGVFIETFALGGDTAVQLENGQLALANRRVEPICAAVERWPELLVKLRELVEQPVKIPLPVYEVLYLVREVRDPADYSAQELELVELLRSGPVMLGDKDKIDIYTMDSARLESEGIVMRAGLTPTDIMQLRGDFDRYDPEASRLVVRYLCDLMLEFEDSPEGIGRFCDKVYDLVEYRLYSNIVRILMRNRYAKAFGEELPPSFDKVFEEEWRRVRSGEGGPLFDLNFSTPAKLIGIGAPTHIFLPAVAEALGTECLVPEHAEVANAVGAIVAEIKASATVKIAPINSPGGVMGYAVHTAEGAVEFEELPDAVALAREEAERQAVEEARRRGARANIQVDVSEENHRAQSGDGDWLDLGTDVTASAVGTLQ